MQTLNQNILKHAIAEVFHGVLVHFQIMNLFQLEFNREHMKPKIIFFFFINIKSCCC